MKEKLYSHCATRSPTVSVVTARVTGEHRLFYHICQELYIKTVYNITISRSKCLPILNQNN